MNKKNTYAEKQKRKLKASKSLADTIKAQQQQIAFLRGGFLSLTGLVGVLLVQADGKLTPEQQTHKQVLMSQVQAYQDLITGKEDGTGND